ncbi:MAG: oligosaccharide flippase family protein [Acidobacteriota bacterium]
MSTVEASAVSETAEVSPAKSRVKGLTHKAYLNAFASLLDACVKGGVLAVVTPLVVSGLGSSLFGVWQILGRLITYMHAADGRPTQALKWVIANRQADTDDELKRRHVGSAMTVWLLFMPILIGVSVLLVWISPYVAKVPAEMFTTIRLTAGLLVANFFLLQLVSLPESVLRGMNLGYKRMGWQAGLNVVSGALTVGALYHGSGLVGLAVVQVILAALTGMLFLIVVRRFVPWFGVARPLFSEVRSFFKLSAWWFAWTAVSKFLMASDILILGVVASATEVATYTLTGFAGTTLLSLVTIALAAVAPGLGGLIGQKKFDHAAAVRVEMMTVSWLLLTAIGSTILLWNRSFIYLWVGPQHYSGFWANLLNVLMIVQLIYIRNDSYFIDLTLQLREKVIMAVIATIISIGASALLIPWLGIAGLCLGMLLGRLALTISYPFVVNKRLGQSNRAELTDALRPAAVMTVMFAVAAYLGTVLVAKSWIVWAACCGLSFALAFGVALSTGLNRESRNGLHKRLTMLRTLVFAR